MGPFIGVLLPDPDSDPGPGPDPPIPLPPLPLPPLPLPPLPLGLPRFDRTGLLVTDLLREYVSCILSPCPSAPVYARAPGMADLGRGTIRA